MRRSRESFGELLLKLPWWVSVILGLAAFSTMRWGLPAWAGQDNTRQLLAKGIVPLAPLALLVFGIFAVGSFWFARSRRNLVDSQTGLESLRQTPWKQFEFMVAEAYRRQGYAVEYSLGRGADGGVDLILRRDGRTALVQCKHWKTYSVGAPVIREMFGLLTAEHADEVIIITSGDFTREARSFSEGKPIRLLDGRQLLALIQSVQAPTPDAAPPSFQENDDSQQVPNCPHCGKPMILRTARRGANPGSRFWGCSAYPACKGILQVSK